jgi:hypothetical protein
LPCRGSGRVEDDLELLAFAGHDERVVSGRQAVGRQPDTPKGSKRPRVERRTTPSEPPRLCDESPRAFANDKNRVKASPVVRDEREDGRMLPQTPPEAQMGRLPRRSCRGSFV